jgi:predicted ferric reductase
MNSTQSSLLWFVARGSGMVAYLLLTATVVLGIAVNRRWSNADWPRLVVEGAHRWFTLIFSLFLIVHIATLVLDPFSHISFGDAVIPFAGTYRTFWVGLGVVAAELVVAIVLSVAVRRWIGYRLWHALHLLTYLLFPLSLLHGIGTGTDTGTSWTTVMYAGSFLAVAAALIWRVREPGVLGLDAQ